MGHAFCCRLCSLCLVISLFLYIFFSVVAFISDTSLFCSISQSLTTPLNDFCFNIHTLSTFQILFLVHKENGIWTAVPLHVYHLLWNLRAFLFCYGCWVVGCKGTVLSFSYQPITTFWMASRDECIHDHASVTGWFQISVWAQLQELFFFLEFPCA